jgi:endonuclease/exonuclease/phosphatase family metal-dependent hydrolase
MWALVVKRPGLTVKKATRVPALETLSKHLLVTLEADGARYAVLVVHLLRPIGKNEAKHLAQLTAIRAWAESMKNTAPETTLVVLGDFNNPGKELLPMRDSAAVTDYAATHLTGKAYDHI